MKWLCINPALNSGLPLVVNSAAMLHKVCILPGQYISAQRMLSGYASKKSMKDYYSLLDVEEGCSLDDVRNSYCILAKKYHPDSGSTTADATMFMRVDEAYRAVLTEMAKGMKPVLEPEEEEDDKSKYKALQHRQFLSYEGVGFGTPSQREKQYTQFRVDRASDLVMDFKKQKLESQYSENTMIAKDIKTSKKVKITQAIERLVEDLIQESMARGDFDNLSGKGKPLDKFSYCPHIDPMTHNLNRILMDNGYQPEWIMKQKEIRETIEKLRHEILLSRKKCSDLKTSHQLKLWNQSCKEFSEDIKNLNKLINDFNLIVPLLNWQMVHFNSHKEIARAERAYETLLEEKLKEDEAQNEHEAETLKVSSRAPFLAWINLLFK
ncbi:dnaJ homolog subfamily C member 28 [Ambystoma mexicanum]|uniref:dnaJ homolog subfamily C member 28 n=1 Tax=Ambystoma mexicanum TaxID=8296 RepID=UPI0037E77BBE